MIQTGMAKVDLHCHSNFSDGLSSIIDIESRCLRTGINAVITDHNEIRGGIELYKRGNILTIPAIEVGTKEGLEFLIYFKTVPDIEHFYKKLIEPNRVYRFMVRMNLSIEKLLNNLTNYQCYVSLAHPFGFGKKSIKRLRSNVNLMKLIESRINGVEVLNGNTVRKSNAKALEYIDSLNNKNITAGSDGHCLNSICSVYTQFESSFDSEKPVTIYEMLLNKNRKAVQKESINMLFTGIIISYEHTKYFINNGKHILK